RFCRGRRRAEATQIAVTESVLAVEACCVSSHPHRPPARPAQRSARSSLYPCNLGTRRGSTDRGNSRGGANRNGTSGGGDQPAADSSLGAAQAIATATGISGKDRLRGAGQRPERAARNGRRRGRGRGGGRQWRRGAADAAQRQRRRGERHVARD